MNKNFSIKLRNNKTFYCDEGLTIFEAAKKNNIILNHSCLSSRCRACIVKVISGETVNREDEMILSEKDRSDNYILSCNSKPVSDLELDIEDLGDITFYDKKIFPSKISLLEKLTDDVIKVVLRLPPNSNFKFNSGQYVNIIKGAVTRSYSIGNCSYNNNQLVFYIKKYAEGLMSQYFFYEAEINDLLRIEGPLGTFFLRDSNFNNIVFMATGTGVAPIKSILDGLDKVDNKYQSKKLWLVVGARYKEDLFWKPKYKYLNIKYIPVLSRPDDHWNGAIGYVQDTVIKHINNFENTQVYACGSNAMINSAKKLFLKNNLKDDNFFSDAFVQSN